MDKLRIAVIGAGYWGPNLVRNVTLTAGVSLGGGVTVGEAAYIGMNASVREQRTVGAGCVLGMGAVLISDQPPGTVYAGVPARHIRKE
jgi:acetyltransferase-like isoleucine patch superfamily enzyme